MAVITQGYFPYVAPPAPTPTPTPTPGGSGAPAGASPSSAGTDVDDDTLQAVLLLWATDHDGLPSLFRHPPRTGRLKGGEAMPYATIASEFKSEERSTRFRKDRRKVTITVRGQKADVTRGLGLILGLFNADLGGPDKPVLTYPSGTRFVRWLPLNSGNLKQDETTRDGLDVWVGTVEAEVTSVRLG